MDVGDVPGLGLGPEARPIPHHGVLDGTENLQPPAVASDGRRYADLDHAFAYRQKVAADCTCNGISTYGTAIIDVSDDPTLRTGDLVATKDGFLKFIGSHSRLRKGGAFTPVTLAEITVTRRKIATTAVAAPHWRSSSVR